MSAAAWSDGYVSEIDYTHGYYTELSPHTLALALQLQRIKVDTRRPLRYLELGFGQGLSLNIHAAATAGEFWGNDFNPAQAAFARELAQVSGANLKVLDDSFEQLAERKDLPEFDVIALHGIWSWISEHNRQVIVDLAKRKLAVGGIFYLSYNCTPGWSAAMPLRHLMALHSQLAGSSAQTVVQRVESALAFTKQVAEADTLFFKGNPALVERLNKISEMPKNYLAHEYFNLDWHPMPHSQVAEMLQEAKLDFGASAELSDHVDAINLSAESQKLLATISNPTLYQTVRDYCTNTQFRKDIWVKGVRKMSAAEQAMALGAQQFVLLRPAADVVMKGKGALGEVTLQEAVYTPLIAQLAARDQAPKTLEALHQAPDLKALLPVQMLQAMTMLCGMGQVSPVQDAAAIKLAKPRTDALNLHLMNRAMHSEDIHFLASPVTGGGVMVPRFHQLYLRAYRSGKRTVADIAKDTWTILLAQGQRLQKGGKTIETEQEHLTELSEQINLFLTKYLPVYKVLALV